MTKFAGLAGCLAGVSCRAKAACTLALAILAWLMRAPTQVAECLNPSIAINSHTHTGAPLQVTQPLQAQDVEQATGLHGYARTPATTAIFLQRK
jgi:hypothetical protein